MKTLLKSLSIKGLTLFILSATLFSTYASAEEKKPRAMFFEKGTKKIMVKGNVEVIIVQNEQEGLIYQQTNLGKVKLNQTGNVLLITSAGDEIAKVILYINNFYRIDASDNATIKSFEELDLKYLQVFLKDNAHAEINSKTKSIYSILNDNSTLKLSGSTDQHVFAIGTGAKLTIGSFFALASERNPEVYLAKVK